MKCTVYTYIFTNLDRIWHSIIVIIYRQYCIAITIKV